MQDVGYSVIRFWSHEARSQTRAVCETILAALEGRLSQVTVATDMRFLPSRPSHRDD
jgi:very-short-patch-repair endonuclease